MSGNDSQKIKIETPEIYDYEPVAIVGIGAIMPDALNAKEFWENIKSGKNSITEVPKERWDPELFYDPDPSVPDKTYTKIGGFIKNFEFNGIQFRIPPKIASKLDPIQQMALTAAKEALEDANYESDSFNKERTAVILGNSMGGEIVRQYTRRVYFPEIVRTLKQTKAFNTLDQDAQQQLLIEVEKEYKSHLEEITEDSMPGELANVIAGRIANVFNLRGKNMTTDAACASSMAAIDEAFKSLVAHEVDAVVCGGADRSMDVSTYVKFCKIGALSPDGSFPFDARANGFVMGEGVGFFVLKRLSDAIRDGNKIYALIRGVGSSSDGKGKGITAPNPIGQQLAIERAYKLAGISPAEVTLIEAHGTSTKVGDVVEVETLHKVFNKYNLPKQSIALGSIKSQIGHLKSAAGAAAIIKTALALYHKILPPSINFETPNPKIDWSNSPFYVNTQAKEWIHPSTKPRKAGVSSFGFGGTNFHVVMEEYDPNFDYFAPLKEKERHKETEPFAFQEFIAKNKHLQGEAFAISGKDESELKENIEFFFNSLPENTFLEDPEMPSLTEIRDQVKFKPNDGYRVAFAANSLEQIHDKKEIINKAILTPSFRKAAQKRGIYFSQDLPTGKIAFVFPGQGSQYVNMLKDLRDRYEIVQKTFEEADTVLEEFLGRKLSEIIFASNHQIKDNEELLKQTQFTQPAMLTADIAIFRLLKMHGIVPEMVAGHSLGEYAALVAAGVLSFPDALKAVAIRGRAMANVDSEDKGTMASVSAPFEKVQEVLKTVDDYVIAANLNSVKRIVISGSTQGVKKAMEKFKELGIQTVPLSVSAAFHTDIVAPAAKELAEFLKTIEFKSPRIKVSSNVLGDFYPDDPDEIRALLEKQVESPVHWIQQCETMYQAGARIFFEVGPKRALATFVQENLEGKDIVSQITNHPKTGDIYQFNDAIALARALGIQVSFIDFEYPKPKVKPKKADPLPKIKQQITAKTEYNPNELANFVKTQPSLQKIINDELFEQFLKHQGQAFNNFLLEAFEGFKKTIKESNAIAEKVQRLGLNLDDIVITGTGVGLPGKFKEIFDERNIELILDGYNFIDPVGDRKLKQQTDKNIVKLVKRDRGQPTLEKINNIRDVIKLAAQGGKFDFVEEFQLGEKIVEAYDRTTKLAIAAGLEALKDAGIPLVRSYTKTSTGSYLPSDWVLPEDLREDTGVIFASAFPGYDSLVQEMTKFYESKYAGEALDVLRKVYGEIVRKLGNKDEYREFVEFLEQNLNELEEHKSVYQFNRKFLFKILSMGHSQFAQLIKAYGPNTQVNAACASTTQAVGIANDWIRSGRCKRVILIGADDASGENLFEWIGSGFLASGAATTKEKVSEAALPFDRRRHGMIIGMGAVGIVIETAEEAKRRGIKPIVKILGTYYSNSAYHGTRLDVNHISYELEKFFKKINATTGLTPEQIANSAMFMSHETYTPARGGSAAAEIQSLRHVFGENASKIIIANTKGFTGHPMGAGIEDAIAIKALQYGKIPPIANFKEPDETLGNLSLSKGGKYNVKYAIRLAAGFGSQLAFALYEKAAGMDRETPQYEQWLKSIGGSKADLIKVGKTLRLKDNGPPKKSIQKTKIVKKVKSPTRPIPATVAKQKSTHANDILEWIANETGYPKDLLDDFVNPVKDLGINAQKLASVVGQTNVDNLTIADLKKLSFKDTSPQKSTPISTKPDSPKDVKVQKRTMTSQDGVIKEIVKIVAEKTGYPEEMLDPNLDMEADLGIDTVKQAELFGLIREHYNIPLIEDLDLSEYNTLAKIADFVNEHSSFESKATVSSSSSSANIGISQDQDEIIKTITSLIAEQTGYPNEMLEPDLDMEADLGIDTVKQAELIGMIRDYYNIPLIEDLDISEYNTIRRIANFVMEYAPASDKKQVVVHKEARDQDRILKTITSIIAEKTGYPEEMLEPDLDMEADLGIDTVKQAELIGVIREHYNIPLIEDLDISEYNTIRKISKFVIENTKPTTEIERKEIEDDKTPILQTITKIIAEKTGYPEEMLEPDLDMEADLGIDTVKQAELIGVIREHYNIPLIEDLDISEYNTISRVADFVMQYKPQESKPQESSQKEKSKERQQETQKENEKSNGEMLIIQKLKEKVSELTGFPAELVEENIDLEKEMGIDNAQILQLTKSLLDDLNLPDMKVTATSIKEIAQEISKLSPSSQKTYRYVIEMQESPRTLDPKNIDFIVLTEEKLENVKTVDLDGLEQTECNHLLILNPKPDFNISKLFEILKGKIDALKSFGVAETISRPKSINDISPITGAIGGMAKTLMHEFNINAKIIAANDLRVILNEFTDQNPDIEVVFDGSKRLVPALKEMDLPVPTDISLPKGSNFIVSGGAQGITFECIMPIVKSSENVRVILIGRTEIKENASEIAQMSDEQLKEKKNELLAQLKEKHEKVTPVMLNKEWSKIIKSAIVYQNIEKLKSMGAEVVYIQSDITAPSLPDKIKSNIIPDKPVFIVHGAGVEISKATKSKLTSEFELVYNIKVVGIENLLKSVKQENVKRIISFTSVAGRFGNATQIDYSAANEYLAKRMAMLKRQGVSATSIDWSAWAEIGMATKDTTMKVLQAAGVTPIPLKDGVARFLSEFFNSTEDEVVISGKLGMLAKGTKFVKNDKIPLPATENKKKLSSQKQRKEEGARKQEAQAKSESTQKMVTIKEPQTEKTKEIAKTRAPNQIKSQLHKEQPVTKKEQKTFPILNPEFPMMHGTITINKIIAGKKVLNLEQDLYLDDHRIDGKAVLPGVMGLEFFTEFVNYHGGKVTGMRSVVFSSPVKLPKDKPLEIFVIPEKVTGLNSIKLTLKSKFIGPDGKQLGDLRPHFVAEIIEGELAPGYPFLPATQSKWFIKENLVIPKEKIYEVFFHGPSFQVLDGIINLGANSISAVYNEPNEPLFPDKNASVHLAPRLIEACFQTAGMYDLLINKTMSLPNGITKIQLYQGFENAKYIHATQTRSKNNISHYNVFALDKDLNVVLELINYEMIHTGTTEIPFNTPETVDEPVVAELMHHVGQITPLAVSISTEAMEHINEEFLDAYLLPSEKVIYARFKVPKRKMEWLAGTIAAKKAISLTFNVPETEVEIIKNKNGKPGGIFEGIEYPVTKTHSNGVAIALSHPDGGVGIDIEKIEPRDPSLIKTAFTNDEIKRFQIKPDKHKLITQLWSIKEASLKAIGTGLKTSLKDTIIKKSSKSKRYTVQIKKKLLSITSVTTDDWVVTLAILNQ